jgi:hypothetical protein
MACCLSIGCNSSDLVAAVNTFASQVCVSMTGHTENITSTRSCNLAKVDSSDQEIEATKIELRTNEESTAVLIERTALGLSTGTGLPTSTLTVSVNSQTQSTTALLPTASTTLQSTASAIILSPASSDSGAAATSQLPVTNDSTVPSGSGLSPGAKAGISIAVIVGTTIAAVAVFFCWRYLRRRPRVEKASPQDEEEEELKPMKRSRDVPGVHELPGNYPDAPAHTIAEMEDTGLPRFELITGANRFELSGGTPEPPRGLEERYRKEVRRSRSNTFELPTLPPPVPQKDEAMLVKKLKRSRSDAGPIISPLSRSHSKAGTVSSPLELSPRSVTSSLPEATFTRPDWRRTVSGAALPTTPTRSPSSASNTTTRMPEPMPEMSPRLNRVLSKDRFRLEKERVAKMRALDEMKPAVRTESSTEEDRGERGERGEREEGGG